MNNINFQDDKSTVKEEDSELMPGIDESIDSTSGAVARKMHNLS